MKPMAGIGRARLGELLDADRRRGQRRLDVRVLGLEDQAGEPAVAVDEVPLVAEAVGLPVQLGAHRDADVEALAVEHERDRHDLLGLVLDRRVLEAELVLGRGAQDQLELRERLLLDAQRVDEVDVVAGLSEPFADDA